MSSPWNPKLNISDNTVHVDDLKISFHRTVRVPDSDTLSALPPSYGTFPLYEVKNHLEKLPYDMSSKGGLLMPMYRKSRPCA
jgi:hypothetical protein